ncbi:hypothetical protein D9M69_648320 [compost metagenome]
MRGRLHRDVESPGAGDVCGGCDRRRAGFGRRFGGGAGRPFWQGLLMRFGARPLKLLISQRFGGHPEFLWITLLTRRLDSRRSLDFQGFRWNACKKSKNQNLYKSTT